MNELEVVHNKVGRPLKWNNVEELQLQIDKYFDKCVELEKPFTITGLCIALDCDRETIRDYKEKDLFSVPIKNAYRKCQQYAEEQMFTSKNPAGAIFALKNYGWSDKQEIDHTVTQKVITVDMIGSIDD